MLIDWNKPLKTASGHEVIIYAKDGAGCYPVHGAYIDGSGSKWSRNWSMDGICVNCNCLGDLINVPRLLKQEFWVNFYDSYAIAHNTFPNSINAANNSSLIARRRVIVDCQEGFFEEKCNE